MSGQRTEIRVVLRPRTAEHVFPRTAEHVFPMTVKDSWWFLLWYKRLENTI